MAEWYKLTNSIDKIPRLTLKVEHRLSLDDIAIVLASANDDTDPSLTTSNWAIMLWPSRVEVLKAVGFALDKRTLEGHYYNCGDSNLEWLRDIIMERLNRLW